MKKTAWLLIIFLCLQLTPVNIQTKVRAAGLTETVTSLTQVPEGYIGIYSEVDLHNIRNNLSGKYILMNDIDLTTATSSGGKYDHNGSGWEPIGSKSSPFKGILDGNGFKIIGLHINIVSDQEIYTGLIGYSLNSKIVNLGLVNGSIDAESTSLDTANSNVFAGGLIGYGTNVVITNSYNDNPVHAFSYTNSYAGGLIASISGSTSVHSVISNSYNTAEIKGKSTTGGIAGKVSWTDILNTYNLGDINKDNSNGNTAGGITGTSNNVTISDSYNKGNITTATSYSNGGGISGSASTTTIKKSANHGSINSTIKSGNVAGLVGSLNSNSSILNSYNTGQIIGAWSVGGIVGTVTNSYTSQSYNAGNIVGNWAGGIYGWSSSSHVRDSYNIGSIRGSIDTAGIISHGEDSSIQNSYNSGRIISSNYNNSGAIAANYEGIIENSYFFSNNTHAVGTGSEEGTERKTLEEMKQISSYQNFDFNSIWEIDNSKDFKLPKLRNTTFSGNEENIYSEIKTKPLKTVYALGEEVDPTGAVLTVRSNFGNEFEVDVTKDMIKGFSNNYLGYQYVPVYYDGLRSDFSITVKREYVVTFKSNDGTVLKTEKVLEGDTATAPEAQVREGQTFIGWDRDFSSIKSNVTITAKYDINKYTVSYFDGDGNPLAQEVTYYGANISNQEAPVKEGYTFIGWFTDKNYQSKFEVYTPIKQDIKLYARFEKTPDIPLNIKIASVDYNKLSINWDQVSGSSGYEIYRSTTIDGPFNYGMEVQTGTTSQYTDLFLDTGKTYYYKVRSYKIIDQDKIFSPFTSIYSGKPALGPSSTLKATVEGFNSVQISWNEVSGAVGYELYRATSMTGAYTNLTPYIDGNGTSYLNENLTSGTTYYYKVRAYKLIDGIKVYNPFSSIVSAKPVLPTITAPKATVAGFNKVKVSWNEVGEADGYEVYRSTALSGTYSNIASLKYSSTLSYTNTNLTPNKNYYYKIRTYRIYNGKKVYSSFSNVVFSKPVLASITSSKVATAGYNKVKVTWGKVSEASGYEIYRSTSKTGTFSKITTLSGNSNSYINGSLTTGRTYYYKIKVYRNNNGTKVYSSYSTIVGAAPVLAAPTNIKATRASSSSIKLTWSKVSEASGYEIYSGTSNAGTYTKLSTTSTNTTVSYTNYKVTKNAVYYYKMKSYRIVNGKKIYSNYSYVVSGKAY
ncbi:InlB B-repeat-containing protein [Bacillus sp. JJ664]